MPSLVTRRFKIYNAEQFKEAFTEASPDHLYLFIGRVQEWPNSDTPPSITESVTYIDYSPWRDMLGVRKITANDMTFSIERVNWTSGTVYDEYNNFENLDVDVGKKPYVLTSTNNVYKCIFNNRGATSTVEPTGTSTSIIDTADGYRWKFMYTISGAEAIKFLTPYYMPIKRLTTDDSSAQWDVQQAAVNGSIEVIDVVSNGSGYIQARSNTIAGITNSSVLVLDNGASSVDNYYSGDTLFITSGLGVGQIRTISSYVGSTRTLTLSSGFNIAPNTSSTYTLGPLITVNGDGSDASAYASIESGQIKSITTINSGSNYSYANVSISGSRGSGATATPYVSPPGGHGSDPVDELSAHNLTLSVRLSGTEGNNLPSNNDFRVIGLLKNPILNSNSALAEDIAYDQTTRLSVINMTGVLERDEMITGELSGATARVVYFANNTSLNTTGDVKVIAVNGTFQNERITGNTSSYFGNVTSITYGELKPYVGDVLYLENRVVSVRTFDQIEDIKITLQY